MVTRKEFDRLKAVVGELLEILFEHHSLYDATLKKKIKELHESGEFSNVKIRR